MAMFSELLGNAFCAAMAATKTLKLELFQAKDADGTDAELITGKAATATANTLANVVTLTLATVLVTQTVTINGVVFTAHTDTTTVADREFAIDGDDTADAAALVVCLNDPDYGVPGVTASSAVGVVTLTSTDPGEVLITASASDSTVTIATTSMAVQVELLAEEMKTNDDFTHVACKVTTTADTVAESTVIRTGSRYGIDQSVGASAA